MIDLVLERLPIWGVFAVTVAIVLLSLRLGFMVGARTRRRAVVHAEGPLGSVVGAILGLLAFILAITFGAAATRFDARRQLLLDDVNAIATAARRAELVPEPHRGLSLGLLRRYVDVRLEAVRDSRTLRRAMVETESLQTALWGHAVAAAREDLKSDIVALYVESVTELMEVHTSRTTVAFLYRIPAVIWAGLLVLTIFSMAAVGYQFGVTGRASRVVSLGLATAFAAVIVIIVLLDRTSAGGIVVSQQPMIDLQRKLAAGP